MADIPEPKNITCKMCGIIKLESAFRLYPAGYYSSTCKSCLNELDKERKRKLRKDKLENVIFKCEICNTEKVLKEFSKLKKNYKKKICVACYPVFLTKQKTEWCKKEHNTNMNYRIKKSLAARLRTVLVKNDSTMNYIGCNIQYLREWFEFNFTPEMKWENYGTYWSIDHVIPVCKFDLTIEQEKFACWNWSNMMPTTVTFNSSKKQIDMKQVDYIIERLEKFKEEGSTTKWFSEEFLFNKALAINKDK